MNNPLISVLMSVYNEKEDWLRKSIESILNQSYGEFEFIIVLDNPINVGAKAILEEYKNKDKRIKLLINEKNIGLTNSLNRALKVVNGEFIARMDADDISVNNRFEVQINYLIQNKEIDFIASNGIVINEDGNELYRTNQYCKSYIHAKESLKIRNIFMHPSWMFRKEILKVLKEYSNIPSAEDYDFLCRMALAGYKFCILEEHLIKYRIRTNGISKSNLLQQKLVSECIRKEYKSALQSNSSYNVLKIVQNLNVKNREEKKYQRASEFYVKGINYARNGKKIRSLINILFSCLISFHKVKDIIAVINLRRLKS